MPPPPPPPNETLYGVKTGYKATYLHGPLPIQAQWNIGSFTMERHECSNDNSVSASLWRGYTVGSSYNAN